MLSAKDLKLQRSTSVSYKEIKRLLFFKQKNAFL